MESSVGYRKCCEDVQNIRTQLTTIEKRVKSSLKDVEKCSSDVKTNSMNLGERRACIEKNLFEMIKATEHCSEQMESVKKYDKMLSDMFPNATNNCEGMSEPKKYIVASDNPFGKLGEHFLDNISLEPLSIDLNRVDYCLILRRYGDQCGFYFDFKSHIKEKLPTVNSWIFQVHVTVGEQHTIIAEECGNNVITLKNSVCKKLILHLSKICKVIVTKKHRKLNCKATHLENIVDVTLEKQLFPEHEDIPLQGSDRSIEDNSSKISEQAQTLLESYRDELTNIFDNYIRSDDIIDLVFLPEKISECKILCAEMKRLIENEYNSWLEFVLFKENILTSVVVRKVIMKRTLAIILESNGGAKGSYRLLLPGLFQKNVFESQPLDEQQAEATLRNLPKYTVHYKPCRFPPIIKNDIQVAPRLLEQLAFLRNYSIVIEDRIYTDHRAILMNFGQEYNICFHYSTLTPPNVHPHVSDICVTLLWLDKSIELATGHGSTYSSAVEDVSKKILVILSGICNIIIRKTCRELSNSKPINFDMRDVYAKIKYWKHSKKLEDFISSFIGNDSVCKKPRKQDIEDVKRLYRKTFEKLENILNKFLLVNDLDDLVFLNPSEETLAFIYGILEGDMYTDKLKVITFNKRGISYFTIMKIIHPKLLTKLLKIFDNEKSQYKLYSAGTLDVTFLWNRPYGYVNEGDLTIPTDIYDHSVTPVGKLLKGPPSIPKKDAEGLALSKSKKTYYKFVKKLAMEHFRKVNGKPKLEKNSEDEYNSDFYMDPSEY